MVQEASPKPRVISCMYSTPGPAYQLPTLTGERAHDPRSIHVKNPSYSFGVRHGHFKVSAGPGPSHFPNPKVNRDGPDGAPQYSLYPRLKEYRPFSTPGPNSLNITKGIYSTYPRYPSYFFAGREKYVRNDTIPASNCYMLPHPSVESSKLQAPSYTLKPKLNLDKFLMAKTPGPAKYCPIDTSITRYRAPTYSITGRNLMLGDTKYKPGPGAHVPVMTSVKPSAPSYSFGVRHSSCEAPLIIDPPSMECSPLAKSSSTLSGRVPQKHVPTYAGD